PPEHSDQPLRRQRDRSPAVGLPRTSGSWPRRDQLQRREGFRLGQTRHWLRHRKRWCPRATDRREVHLLTASRGLGAVRQSQPKQTTNLPAIPLDGRRIFLPRHGSVPVIHCSSGFTPPPFAPTSHRVMMSSVVRDEGSQPLHLASAKVNRSSRPEQPCLLRSRSAFRVPVFSPTVTHHTPLFSHFISGT